MEFVRFSKCLQNDFWENLNQIQFYISNKIVLYKEFEFQKMVFLHDNPRNQRVLQNKKSIEIIIPKLTPGVLKKREQDVLYIQFEPSVDGKERLIPFRRKESVGNDYELPGIHFIFSENKIVYGGEEYSVKFEKKEVPDSRVKGEKAEGEIESWIVQNDYPTLLVEKLNVEKRYQKISRQVPGLKVEK